MNSTNKEFTSLLGRLLNACETSPRGIKTRELLAHQTTIRMADPRVTLAARNIGEAFRYAEAAWILSGDNRVSTIGPYAKMIKTFSDDGIRYFGSYGPKVVDQLSYVAQKIVQDSDTRQAVMNIWRENPGPTRDVPCTLSLQFLVRNGELHCVATMRSSDAWLGWPYDVFNFSMIAWAVCIYVRQISGQEYRPGFLFLTAGSQHLYESNFSAAKGVINDGTENDAGFPLANPHSYGSVDALVQHLWETAAANRR